MFRAPITTKEENASFYSNEYQQGFTTSLPDDRQLSEMLAVGFSGTEKEYRRFIELLEHAGAEAGDRLFDYGCSWGYGSWQFMQKGFQVEAYEVAGRRAAYARNKLGVTVHGDLACVEKGKFDMFFSSHVLEHVPSVKETIEFGMECIKPGGLFVALTPNGSLSYLEKNEKSWVKSWGMVHPNLLDEGFYLRTFPVDSIYLSSNPYDEEQLRDWADSGGRIIGRLDGDELLVIVRKARE